MIVIDELSSFKSHRSKRFKALMKVRSKVKRIVGLTGTPSSNGLMDLWAEFRLLDMGVRLVVDSLVSTEKSTSNQIREMDQSYIPISHCHLLKMQSMKRYQISQFLWKLKIT